MFNKKIALLVSSVILSAGIFGAGYSVGKALYLAKSSSRTVTVKGLTERNVTSDLGIWEIDYREIGNNLTDLNQRLVRDQQAVTAFLKQHGFSDQEISVQPIKVDDKLANAYQTNTATANDQRYILTGGVRIRSEHVGLIAETNQAMGALLQQGISLAFDVNNVSPNPSYYFTQLDTIRPSMMADATRSARSVAEQFAKDSGTELGNIQTANQGIFEIMSRDSSTMNPDWNSTQNAFGSIDKKVRLVTTLVYRLR